MTHTRAQTLILAAALFAAHPDIQQVYATLDGNVFLPTGKNLAQLHANQTRQELLTIDRAEALAATQPADDADSEPVTTGAGEVESLRSIVEAAAELPAPALVADAAPTDAAPVDTAPVDTAPTDAAPAKAAPTDAAPAKAAPAKAAPAKAAPAKAAPSKAAPAGKDKASKAK